VFFPCNGCQPWCQRFAGVELLACVTCVSAFRICFLVLKDLYMKPKKLNSGVLWMQFEDVLAPRLGLSVKERAVYSHLLRHSLVVGKPRLQFAVIALARTLGLSFGAARQAVRRLDELGALRVLERSKRGHLAEMRVPEKIRAIRLHKNDALEALGAAGVGAAGKPAAASLDSTDFLKTWALRKAIHDRERGACFYCLRRTPGKVRCLDHVVPRVRFGRNSYSNLVSCCIECNTRKGDRAAPDFLRTLYRLGRLTPAELDARLRALKDLAAGKLRPALLENGK
jgi:5-methylcytosine-specific restriction endonuclease McrA